MRLPPQQKKALSYARDHHNAYGENDKSSRKNIPRRKRLVNRANRHATRQQLTAAVGPVDAERAERADVRLHAARPKIWRKYPDIPLGSYLNRHWELATRRASAPPL